MTAKFIIEVNDDNPFNEGWLLRLLGQPRPIPPVRDNANDTDVPSPACDGWDMANDTPTVRLVARSFATGQDAYKVTVEEPKAAKAKEPVTE